MLCQHFSKNLYLNLYFIYILSLFTFKAICIYIMSSSSLFYFISECANELISTHICFLSLFLGSYPSVFFFFYPIPTCFYFTLLHYIFLKKNIFLPWKPVCFLMTDGGVFGWKGKWEGTERRKGGSVIGIYYIRQKPIFTKKK